LFLPGTYSIGDPLIEIDRCHLGFNPGASHVLPDRIPNADEGDADTSLPKVTDQAKQLVSDGIDEITGKPLPIPIVTSSFGTINFTLDPIPSSLEKDAADAKDVGLIDSSDLEGIYDLTLLNEFLEGQGKDPITP